MGVCAGIAEYTGINRAVVRIATFVSLFTPISAFTFPAYFVAAFVLDKKPPHLYAEEQEQKYWQGLRKHPKRAAREVRSRMRDIDRRLAAMESYYVSSNPGLNAEIEKLR